MIIHVEGKEFPKTYQVLNNAYKENVFSGCQFGVWSKKSPQKFFSGFLGEKHKESDAHYPQSEKNKITGDTLFDISSLTKVISTTTLVALLVERGWLSWETPLNKFFPYTYFEGIQIHHLLSHTAGLLWWDSFYEQFQKKYEGEKLEKTPMDERQAFMRKLVSNKKPETPVSQQAVYSDLGFMLLGFICEDILQMDLDEAFRRYIARPMGLKNTFFHRVKSNASEFIHPNCAATENSSWRGGVLMGLVHDDNCYAMGGYGGHAGLFSTATDILLFVNKLISGFLTRPTLKKIWTKVERPPNCTRTLGWDTPSDKDSSTGQLFSKNSVGHLGFTGCSLWLALDEGLSVVLLTNRVYPTRENPKIKEFRPLFHDAVIRDWQGL